MKKSLLCAAVILWTMPAEAAVEDLINAVKAQDLQAVQTLLANGEDVNAQNELGNSALHYAIALDDADMARLLLDNGANMKLNNAKGWSPLTIAEKKKVQNVGPVLVESIQRKRDAAIAAAQAQAAQVAAATEAKATPKTAEVKEKVTATATTATSAVAPAAVTTPVAVVEPAATPAAPVVDNSANEELLKRAAVALRESKEAQKQAEADKETALKAQKSAEQKADALEKRVKELEQKLATQAKPAPKPVAKAAAKPAPQNVKPSKVVAKQLPQSQAVAQKAQPKPQPAPQKVVLQKSSFSADMYAGDEEIVYCLDLLGQGENKFLAPAAAFYAAANGINEARYNQLTGIVDNFYKSADEAMLEQRRQQCSAVITPQDAVKQNQIIRSMNKAIGY